MEEQEKTSTVDRNQLIRIGVLLVDIGRNLPLPVEEEEIIFIENEFMRIASEIMDIWTAREIGLVYYLQFHLAEAKRLLRILNKETNVFETKILQCNSTIA